MVLTAAADPELVKILALPDHYRMPVYILVTE